MDSTRKSKRSNAPLYPCPTLNSLNAVMPLISLGHFYILKETNRNRKIKSPVCFKLSFMRLKKIISSYLQELLHPVISSSFLCPNHPQSHRKHQEMRILFVRRIVHEHYHSKSSCFQKLHAASSCGSTCVITVHTNSLSQLLTAVLERMVKVNSRDSFNK